MLYNIVNDNYLQDSRVLYIYIYPEERQEIMNDLRLKE